jgi:hypothetical protein
MALVCADSVKRARAAAYAWRIEITTAKPMRHTENDGGAGWRTVYAMCMRGSYSASLRRMAEENPQTVVRTGFSSMPVDSSLKQHAARMEHAKAKRRREAGV